MEVESNIDVDFNLQIIVEILKTCKRISKYSRTF